MVVRSMGEALGPRMFEESAAVRCGLFGRMFAVRWIGAPTEATAALVQRHFRAQARDGRSLLYCGISDGHAEFRDADTQRAMVRTAFEIMRTAESFDLVLEGSTLSARMTRSLVRGMVTAARVGNSVLGFEAGEHIRKAYVHDTLTSMLRRVGDSAGVTSAELRRMLEQAKMLEAL